MRRVELIAIATAVAAVAGLHMAAHSESLLAAAAARLFYVPVFYAAVRGGWRLGLGFGLLAALAHAGVMWWHAEEATHHSEGFLTEHYVQAGLLWVAGLGVGWLVDQERHRRDERDRVRRLFDRFTAPEVVEHLLASGADLHPERRTITVLFADLRGFTALAERLQAEQVVGLLDDFYSAMVEIVLEERGTVDKFAGDQVMALFGFPLHEGDEATRALDAARRMQGAFTTLSQRWQQTLGGGEVGALGLGIGINTGDVVLGSVGSEQRADFTVVGDAVNVAARLCGAAKHGEVVVGEATHQRLPARSSDDPDPGVPETLQVKGKSALLNVVRYPAAQDGA